jgi:alkanesulfonate monooxygenase SsuD/methylene tetrahydromethanopterin reductase-like flavin-dependent oxidoreductase (luciferase family)
MTVHRWQLFGALLLFNRVVKTVLVTAWAPKAGFSGVWLGGHHHPKGGATAACPVPTRPVKLAVESTVGGHRHPMSGDTTAVFDGLAETNSKG